MKINLSIYIISLIYHSQHINLTFFVRYAPQPQAPFLLLQKKISCFSSYGEYFHVATFLKRSHHFLSRMAYKYIFEGFIKISVNCCNFVACFSIRCSLLLIILSKHSQQKTFQSQIEGEENIQKSTVMSSISKVMNDEDIKQENFGGEDSITLWLYFFQSYPMCIFIYINFIISNFNFLPFV